MWFESEGRGYVSSASFESDVREESEFVCACRRPTSERAMKRSYDATETTAEEYGVDMRTAAQLLGIKRVADAVATRGIYP